MSLNDVLNTMPNGSWLSEAGRLASAYQHLTLSNAESRRIVTRTRHSIEADDVTSACNYMLCGLILDNARFLNQLRKDGTLRISRRAYESATLSTVVETMSSGEIALPKAARTYLRSMRILYRVAPFLRAEYVAILEWLREEREHGVKSAYACLEFLCLKQAVGIHETTTAHVPSRNIYFFSVEQLAEGLSTILAIYGREFGELRHTGIINSRAAVDGFYFTKLNSAAHLATFRDWEWQVDRFGFEFREGETAGMFELVPPSEEFLQAVELGYIQSGHQRHARAAQVSRSDDKSFMSATADIANRMKDGGLIKYVEQPLPRYRLELPQEILSMTARIGELLREEKIDLSEASRDLLTPVEELLAFEITPDLTVRDLFLASRLFSFMRALMARVLVPEVRKRPEVVLNSLVVSTEREALRGLLATAVEDKSADAMVPMLQADIVGGHVDIQYQPNGMNLARNFAP